MTHKVALSEGHALEDSPSALDDCFRVCVMLMNRKRSEIIQCTCVTFLKAVQAHAGAASSTMNASLRSTSKAVDDTALPANGARMPQQVTVSVAGNRSPPPEARPSAAAHTPSTSFPSPAAQPTGNSAPRTPSAQPRSHPWAETHTSSCADTLVTESLTGMRPPQAVDVPLQTNWLQLHRWCRSQY